MPIRPEDYGGTTDPLATFANTSTMPGRGAGKAIDPSKPSLERSPRPTADRIAELERELNLLEDCKRRGVRRHMSVLRQGRIDVLRAELSRLRNPELNSRGEPMDRATIARGRKPTDAENAPLRNEQPKGGITQDLELPIRSTVAKAGPAVDARYNGSHSQEEEHRRQVAEGLRAPSSATSPGPQDVRERLLSAAKRYDELLSNPTWKPTRAHLEDARNIFRDAFPALSQSDAQPVGWQSDALYLALDYGQARLEEEIRNGEPHSSEPLRAIHKRMVTALEEYEAKKPATPPSLPEGAREALEKAANILHVALYGHGYIGGITDSDNWRDCVIITERIAAALATPTPPSAGLIEAAEGALKTLEETGGAALGIAMSNEHPNPDEVLTGVFHSCIKAAKKLRDALRARAADRSAT